MFRYNKNNCNNLNIYKNLNVLNDVRLPVHKQTHHKLLQNMLADAVLFKKQNISKQKNIDTLNKIRSIKLNERLDQIR